VAVGGIDHQHIDAGFDQHLGALLGAGADADRGADAQAALIRPCRRTGARWT
jgi:hypothetical protein